MTRKWISILISGLLVIGCLTGCSSNTANTTESSSEQVNISSSSVETAPEESSPSGSEPPAKKFPSLSLILKAGRSC